MKRNLSPRRGWTLIELLVVISLILVLSSLALLISPRLVEDQRSARAADHLSGWLLIAKQRSFRDQQVRGVRLVPDADNPNVVKELVYIERPEDYRGGMLQSPSPLPPPGYPPTCTAFVHGKDLTNNGPGTVLQLGVPSNLTNESIVQPGDFLVFDSLEAIPYNTHLIFRMVCFAPNPAAGMPQGGTQLVLANAGGNRPSYLNGSNPIQPLASDQFRFVRQPRPMAGEPSLQLPRDMIIDLDPSTNGTSVLPGFGLPDGYDIMFSPRGQMYGSNALSGTLPNLQAVGGKIVLRIRNGTRPQTDGDQNYVVIYTRSGMITTHPVNFTPGPGPQPDYYKFLKDGNSSGF